MRRNAKEWKELRDKRQKVDGGKEEGRKREGNMPAETEESYTDRK